MADHTVEITADGRCYRIDIGKRALFRGRDERIKLTRQQWELLRFFVERPQHSLLIKNELVANVWANNASVTDDAVSLAVKSLRRVLEDRRGDFIQTEHGQGYRFAGDIRRLSETETKLVAASGSSHEALEPLECMSSVEALGRAQRARPSASAAQHVGTLIGTFLTPLLEYAVIDRDPDLIAALVRRGANINNTDVTVENNLPPSPDALYHQNRSNS